jgi:hypothetical protein
MGGVGCAREDDLLRERKAALIYRIAVILAGPVIARLATERRPTGGGHASRGLRREQPSQTSR